MQSQGSGKMYIGKVQRGQTRLSHLSHPSPHRYAFFPPSNYRDKCDMLLPKGSCLSFGIWVNCGRASHMRGLSCYRASPGNPHSGPQQWNQMHANHQSWCLCKAIWQAGTAWSIASGVHGKIINHWHTHTYTRILWRPYSQRLTKGQSWF